MAPKTPSAEFPLLQLYGLMATEITGDGNCLFNAFSDQMYGHEGENAVIRARVIEEMRSDPENYKGFLAVNPRGVGRRNPKRKTHKNTVEFLQEGPSSAQVEATWQDHLLRMSKRGCYGDNPEIVAFTKAYNVDVLVFSYNSRNYIVRAADDGAERPIIYIALHAFEHYSSVRKINGPLTGLPEITFDQHPTQEQVDAQLEKGPTIQDWQIEVIQSSLPTHIDETVIRQAIKQHNGNIDSVVSEFLDSQYYSSAPGTPGSLSESGSSSFGREQDSDDEDTFSPNKRQDRRMSKAKRGLQTGQREHTAKLTPIPLLEVTAPDAVSSRYSSPEVSAIERIRNSIDIASSATSEEDTNSEYTASVSSRAQSVALGTTPPRARIILRTASQRAKLERHRGKASGSQETPPPEARLGGYPASKPKRITARDRIAMRKMAQKQQAKERKQGKLPADHNLTTTSVNIKRNSPPMDKVLSLGTLSMIQI